MRPIDVRSLVGHPGTTLRVSVSEPVEDLGVGLGRIAEDRPVTVEVSLESVLEGISVDGRIRGTVTLTCARCLKIFDEDLEFGVSELFRAMPGEDEYRLNTRDAQLDLEPMLRDVFVLAMPFSPICVPDCKGICERCGGDRNLGECSCAPEAQDPRWTDLGHLTAEG